VNGAIYALPYDVLKDFEPISMISSAGQAQHGSHLCGELFKMVSGIEMLHVPYRGSAPMLIDLLSGQVQLAFDNLPASIGHIRADKLR